MYEIVNSKVVKATVAPGREVIARRGGMIAYQGEVLFGPVFLGGGAGGFVGRQISGEDQLMMHATGNGTVWYGYGGFEITRIEMDGMSTLTTESSRILCHDASLQTSVVSTSASGGGGGLRGALRGAVTGQGMMTTQINGIGTVVVISHGDTIEIPVRGGGVTVDPQAYVGHKGQLTLKLTAKVGWRDAVGRGSGEAFQLDVSGQGSVLVQASEMKF